MTAKQKRRILATAIARHGDTPTLEQAIKIAFETDPGYIRQERLLRAVLSFELSEAYKRNRFIRESASEQGVDPTLSIRAIRREFEKAAA